MELEFFGGNCFRVKTKQTTIVIDDNLKQLGKKTILNDKNSAALFTSKSLEDKTVLKDLPLVIDSAGEFEIGDMTVKGVQVRSHMDTEGQKTGVLFQFMYANQTITITGHIHPDLEDEALELISGTDVLVLPVGGNGYTLDAIGAASIIKKVEPDYVVPSHYAEQGLKYEVPASTLADFSKVVPLNLNEQPEVFKLSKSIGDETGTQTKIVSLAIKN